MLGISFQWCEFVVTEVLEGMSCKAQRSKSNVLSYT